MKGHNIRWYVVCFNKNNVLNMLCWVECTSCGNPDAVILLVRSIRLMLGDVMVGRPNATEKRSTVSKTLILMTTYGRMY